MATPLQLTRTESPDVDFVVDPETMKFHLLDLVDVPQEVRRFQTCLRAWFTAYVIAFEEASSTQEELAHDAMTYQLLDDMLSDMLKYTYNPDRDGDEYQDMFLTPIRFFSNELTQMRKRVRDWFSDFVSVFDERADEHSMKIHSYAFTTIDEYLLTYIAQRQQRTLTTS